MSSSPLETEKTPSWVGQNIKAVVNAFVLYLLFTTFLFQPFNIPSESMLRTLKIGDFLFVSKYAYGFGRYSFPIDMVWLLGEGRLFFTEPKRGDIIVFENEKDEILVSIRIKTENKPNGVYVRNYVEKGKLLSKLASFIAT
jgi:signal peptidase I